MQPDATGTIHLLKPDLTRGLPLMRALEKRATVREWALSRQLPLQDLSDLLWAANGINRPDSGRRTAPTARNSQELDIYVFTDSDVYLHNPRTETLTRVLKGDRRGDILLQFPDKAPAPLAPVELVLVSDSAKFPLGSEERRRDMGNIDAGIVSQNISLFCAATGLVTCPRASVDVNKLGFILNLAESRRVVMEHPVAYPLD